MWMKVIQISMEEGLLARVDAEEEVRRKGRSAVFRRAVEEYLKRQSRRALAKQYRQAYVGGEGLGADFDGWEDEGEWPSP